MTLGELLKGNRTLVDKSIITEITLLKDYQHEIDSINSFRDYGIPNNLLELEVADYYYRIEDNNMIFVANVFRKEKYDNSKRG